MRSRACLLVGVLGAIVSFDSAPRAQNAPATPYDHVHLAVPNPQQAYAWYVERLNGNPAEFPGRVAFELWRPQPPLPVQLLFSRAADARPSEGSTIESVGLSFPDQQGAISDPWGVKIELVDDARLRGFHHVRLSNMYLIVAKGNGTASRGRAIDHVSWGPTDIHATVADFKARSQKVVAEPSGPNTFGHHVAFVEDPNGVYIELVQHNEFLKKP